jgi:hypothetical protein
MTGKPKIPEAREILQDVLSYHKLDVETRIKLRDALSLMYREKYKQKKAPAKNRKMTAYIRDTIKKDVAQNPTKSLQTLANELRVNSGRISEVLAGDFDHL